MIANLRAVLGLDSKGFKAGVRGADREAQSFRQRISGIGKAIGIAFSVGAVLNFGKSLVSWSSEIVHAARNANLFTSEMMALNRVVEAAGGTTREAQNIFARFSAEVGEAIFEGKELKQAYLDLGLSVENLAGRDDMERLRMLARAIRDSENPTRTLVSLFGIRGANMRASFEAIADGLDDVTAASARGAEKAERLATAFGKFWDNVKAQTVGALDFYFGENEIEKASRDVTRHMEREQQKRAEIAAQRDADAARQKQIEEDRAKAVAAEWSGLVELDRQNKVLAESRLQGLEKMEAEHNRVQESIREQMDQSTDKERDLLQIRSDMLKKHYEEDVAAFKKVEQDKADAETDRVKQSLRREINRIKEQGQTEMARAQGEGVQFDALAQYGGFTGGARFGLAMEDKDVKVAEKRLEMLRDMEAEHERAQQAIREQMDQSTDKERDALEKRSAMLRSHYEKDVAAFRKAEQEKMAAENERARKSLQQQADRANERGDTGMLRSHGTGAESNAPIRPEEAGHSGRTGLAMEDRTLKVNAEQLRVLSEIKPLIQRMKELAEMNREVAGGL